jgi:glycerophosphoryl diester phosphodiesterase
MPENTIEAMLRAIDLGVNTLEMDVVISADKLVVVSHEAFFNHEISTKPDGKYVEANEEQSLNIYKMNYDEIRRFDVGLKPHRRFPQQEKLKTVKPLLRDLIDSVEIYCSTKNKTSPNYNIEIKSEPSTDGIYHPDPKEFTDLLVNLIREKGIERRTNIQSFDFRPLQYLRQEYPSIRIAMLIEADDERNFDEQLKQLGFTPDIYSPEHTLVNPEMVKTCHKRNMKIIPWTVNDKNRIQALISFGVDGIITDFPDLFENSF